MLYRILIMIAVGFSALLFSSKQIASASKLICQWQEGTQKKFQDNLGDDQPASNSSERWTQPGKDFSFSVSGGMCLFDYGGILKRVPVIAETDTSIKCATEKLEQNVTLGNGYRKIRELKEWSQTINRYSGKMTKRFFEDHKGRLTEGEVLIRRMEIIETYLCQKQQKLL